MSSPDVRLLTAEALLVKAGGKRLLDHVSLQMQAGELVGLIGPSGAGKSTLLNALSGYRRATGGTVRVDGVDLYRQFDHYRALIGYVPQDDIVHRELTPYQVLRYAGLLRLPPTTTKAQLESRIDAVLQWLGLSERKHLAIHKLSGGQRKRASIGVELLTQPHLFYLDEPTSGLDPGLEASFMQLLKGYAAEGRIVCLTTHVMSNLHLLDKLCVLVGGKLAYWGPPQAALDHFGIDHLDRLFAKLGTATAESWQARFATAPKPVLRPPSNPHPSPLPPAGEGTSSRTTPQGVDAELEALKARLRPPE